MPALSFGTIRAVGADESRILERVAQLHVELLGFGPLAVFGPRLVREFGYRLPIQTGLLQLSIYEAAGDIGGFIAITTTPESLYRDAVRQHWPRLAMLMAASLLESPRRLRDLARALRIWHS